MNPLPNAAEAVDWHPPKWALAVLAIVAERLVRRADPYTSTQDLAADREDQRQLWSGMNGRARANRLKQVVNAARRALDSEESAEDGIAHASIILDEAAELAEVALDRLDLEREAHDRLRAEARDLRRRIRDLEQRLDRARQLWRARQCKPLGEVGS